MGQAICCLLKQLIVTNGHDGCSPFSQNDRIAPAQACLAMKLPSKSEAICEVELHEQLVPLSAECQCRHEGLV